MTIAPIIIQINNRNAGLYYEIDFDFFKKEMSQLPGVEIVDSYCFGDRMLIGVNINCEDLKTVTIMKRFFNFFKYRWMIKKQEIHATFDNDLPLIDYPNP